LPFKNILTPKNLFFVEYENKPIGFLLWLPDFNQILQNNSAHINFNKENFDKIDTFKLMEIAVIPKFQKKRVDFLLFTELMRVMNKTNYKYCEGGFILNQNKQSMNMSQKYLKRLFDPNAKIHRQYAIFETSL